MTFKKYPKIKRLGDEENKDILLFGEDTLVVEEKVDGGNGSFWLEEDGIHFGSRNRDLTAEEDTKAFASFQIALRTQLDALEEAGVKINPNYIYYIEWMQKHTIGYGLKIPKIIGLDIRMKHAKFDEGIGLFLGRETRLLEFERLQLPNTFAVWRGTVNEFKKIEIKKLVGKSNYYDGKMEGVVIKNYCRRHPYENHQLYAKIVSDEFKENNKAVFGGVRQKNTDTQKIIEEFATDARIKKAILKFTVEESMSLDLKLMSKVPTYVIKDILKEEFQSIFNKYKFIDFKEMKQKISKRCLAVINEEMIKKGKGGMNDDKT